MYVCVCNAVTERQVRELVKGGCVGLAELRTRTGLGAECGTCLKSAAQLLRTIQAGQGGVAERGTNVIALPLLSHVA